MTPRQKVLGYLQLRPMSAGDISRHSRMPVRTAAYHIKTLADECKVRPVGFGPKPARGTQSVLWFAHHEKPTNGCIFT